MKDDDRSLAKRIASGDEKAFEELIRQYGGLIKAIVGYHLSSVSMWQEDCINDILFKLWQNIKSYDPERSSLKNWVAAVAKYRCIDFKRKYLRETADVLDENTADRASAERLLKQEITEEINSLLSGLSEADRDIFIKRYIYGATVEEISSARNKSPSYIYTRLSRGRKKLRRLFIKERL